MRALSVQESALCEAARALRLGRYLRMGHGEEMSGGRDRPSILADAMEAVLGAVYLDGGLEAARSIVDRFLPTAPEQVARDYKTELQIHMQDGGGMAPLYRIAKESGPPHNRVFTAEVAKEGRIIGTGSGTSKKAAEQAAAKDALDRLGRPTKEDA
jgi:ribonuclease-3